MVVQVLVVDDYQPWLRFVHSMVQEAFEFEVVDADPRRIKRLKIWPLSARGAKPPEAPAAHVKGPDGA